MINHPWGGCSCSCGIIQCFMAKVWGESWETTTLALQSKANKGNNHFNFLLSPRPKQMIACDLEDPKHLNHNHNNLHKDKCEWKKSLLLLIVVVTHNHNHNYDHLCSVMTLEMTSKGRTQGYKRLIPV